MSWRSETYLRDLDGDTVIEATCLRCRHSWRQSADQLRFKTGHVNMCFDEIEKEMACKITHCRHVGVRLMILPNNKNTSFIGGMP